MTDDGQSTGSASATYRISSNESLSEGVIRAVSDASGSEPVPKMHSDVAENDALEPLCTAIDPEALDSVFRPPGTDAARSGNRITFPYHGYWVTVRSEGTISVEQHTSANRTASD